nr:hypothetical protein [uncultured Flavobacterium sp.]
MSSIKIKETIKFLEKEISKSENLLKWLESEESIKSLEFELILIRDEVKEYLCREEGQFYSQGDIAIAEKEILKLEKLLKSLKSDESIKSLKTKEELKRDRTRMLLFIKQEQFYFQSDIAVKIGRTEKTIRSWIQKYSKNGYRGLLQEKRGGNNTRVISDKAKKFISKAVKLFSERNWDAHDLEISFFIELKSLIEESHGEKIDYHAFYSYFRRNYKEEFKLLREMFSEKRKIKAIAQRSKKQEEREWAEYGF